MNRTIREPERDLSEPKTLKVTLPTRFHLQLHRLKILGGQSISETVEKALEAYFEDVRKTQSTDDVEVEADAEAT